MKDLQQIIATDAIAKATLALAVALAFPASGMAQVNSCSNVTTNFSYYFRDNLSNGFGFFARGTFRIPEETDESKQPAYNLARVRCERKPADYGTQAQIECTVTEASVGAQSGAPSANSPNCILDVDVSVYPMKELAPGILTGVADGGGSINCFDMVLTINRNTKRVFLSAEKTKYAEKYNSISSGSCNVSSVERKKALMNCTGWVALSAGKAPSEDRMCDFEEH